MFSTEIIISVNIEDIVLASKSIERRLESFAQKVYIDSNLKKLVSADLVNVKLKQLRDDLSLEAVSARKKWKMPGPTMARYSPYF